MRHDRDQAVQVPSDSRKLRELAVADDYGRLHMLMSGGQEIPENGRHCY